MHAKIFSTTIITFPYDVINLQSENPYTNFGNIEDIPALYSLTEEAQKTGNVVVSVEIDEAPNYDPSTEYLQYDHNSLRVENGHCVLGWKIEKIEKNLNSIVPL